jgi:hypothetical protein
MVLLVFDLTQALYALYAPAKQAREFVPVKALKPSLKMNYYSKKSVWQGFSNDLFSFKFFQVIHKS